MYLHEQGLDLFDFYFDKLKHEVTYGGHAGVTEYLILLQSMDEDKMQPWERRMLAEVNQLRLINEDVKAL
mgnify:CR=1 FL=1